MAEWFAEAFGELYPQIYPQRNLQEAQEHWPALKKLARLEGESLVILDMGCGAGRYSELARKDGHSVISLDYSFALLQQAQKEYPLLDCVRGDMRHLPLPYQSLDRVLCLFTSFGYFTTDQENISVMCQYACALKPGALLYLDYLNPTQVRDRDWRQNTVGDLTIRQRVTRDLSLNLVCKDVTIARETLPIATYQERVKLYDRSWFEKQGVATGLKLLSVYGDYQGNSHSLDSPRAIYLFQKLP